MKKAIQIPLIIGIVFGALNFITTAAGLMIPLGADKYAGMAEIFTTFASALGGPLGILFAEIGVDISAYTYYTSPAYPNPQAIYLQFGNFLAHFVAGMFVVFAYKFIYEKHLKTPLFIAAWAMLSLAYYYVFLLPLQILFLGIPISGLTSIYIDFTPEALFTAVFTTLLMLALPMRYCRPQWIESQPVILPAETRA